MAAPVLWGLLSSIVGSNPGAPQQQALFEITHRNQSSASLQSFQLSELRNGATLDQDIHLYADAFSGPSFVWPAIGEITSHMDYSHPMGIDIGLDNSSLSPIAAAARGTVSFAGGSESEGYGYYVKIDHGDGLVTLYAHLSEILVYVGQEVGQGDVIGYGGSTGKSSGKHLHFEVRQGGYLADPLDILPVSPEPQRASLDCQTGFLTVERGAVTNLEFAESLPQGTKLISATITGIDTGRSHPSASLVSNTAARIDSMPGLDLVGNAGPDHYSLNLVIEGVRHYEKKCQIQVVSKTSHFTPFSEASYVASTNGSPFEEPTPEPEPVEYIEPTVEPEQSEQPIETPTEVLPTPTEVPLVIPTNVPMLGEVASPTPSPTNTPAASATPVPTESSSPTAEPTATQAATTATPEPTVASESTTTPAQ